MTANTAVPEASVEAVRANPYVGPRSLQQGESIFGRDVEIREVRAALLAHRLVLLYSQSGAGKTSLIEAGLRPQLEEREFQVFPTIRVGYELPDDAPPGANRYRLSVLASLEESRPEEAKLERGELIAMGLDEYFRRLDAEWPDRDPCLVFDQFEELFTLDPIDWDEKEAFLGELGLALTDRGRWALFSMREDFIAHLDPYLNLIPTGLSSRYRIDLLGPEAAMEAITKPADELGVNFTEQAAELLIDDLRRVQVQRGGKLTRELGPSVEPVQLQVVCNQLWESLPAGTKTIGTEEARRAGDVNKALAGFYDSSVKSAASGTKTREREIRNWFEHMLITVDGFRTQVREGPGRSGATVLQSLRSMHLIRSDRIRGAEWYELSHDRFVEPIRASNADFKQRRRRRGFGVAAVAVAGVVVLWLGLAAVLADDPVDSSPDLEASGIIAKPGDEFVYPFDAEPGDDVVAMIVPSGELNPDVVLLDPDGVSLAGSVGFNQPGEPVVVAAQDVGADSHSVVVRGSRGTTGEFGITLLRPRVTGLAPGEQVSNSVTVAAPVGIHTFIASGTDPTVVTVTPDTELVASVSVFDPRGATVATVVGFADSPAAVVVADLAGDYLVAVTAVGGTVGGYEVGLEKPDVEWNLAALIPKSAGDVGPSDYWIDVAGTSYTCEPFDTSGLISEEAVGFTPKFTGDHWLWAWTAEFDSPDGVRSYLDSWGSGCTFEWDENSFARLVPPTALDDEALWYVVLIENSTTGSAKLNSVGVLATSDRSVAEASLAFIPEFDDTTGIEIDPERPYEDAVARALAEDLAGEVIRVIGELPG